MNKRIDKLAPKTVVTLRFYSKNGEYEVQPGHEFVGVTGAGEQRRAAFWFVGDDKTKPYAWEAYRYLGRWCYGTGAHRVTLHEEVM